MIQLLQGRNEILVKLNVLVLGHALIILRTLRYLMAELALVGTVTESVATSTHFVVKVANFVDAVDDALENIIDIRNELKSVNDTLQEIKGPVQSQSDHLSQSLSGSVAKVTQDCTSVYLNLNKLIDGLGKPRSKRVRFFFVVFADSINTIRSTPQNQKGSLGLAWQLVL